MRGATSHISHNRKKQLISIHTPHAGSDSDCPSFTSISSDFNPHSPCGERRLIIHDLFNNFGISIHTPHAGSDLIWDCLTGKAYRDFNPHSPCGERLMFLTVWKRTGNFNPHSPCGERPRNWRRRTNVFGFQSTLPMRGATIADDDGIRVETISIHTPHAGSD